MKKFITPQIDVKSFNYSDEIMEGVLLSADSRPTTAEQGITLVDSTVVSEYGYWKKQ